MGRARDREGTRREVDKLRTSIQTLTRNVIVQHQAKRFLPEKVSSRLGLGRISGRAGLSGPGYFILPDYPAGVRHIRPDPVGTGHPAFGKKYQIRPNPNHAI